MFVQTNTVKSIKSYFTTKLSDRFSENEIKIIGNEAICNRLGLTSNDLIGINDQLLSESDLLYFRSVVKRLLNNEPFQYVIGSSFFFGLELKSDARALIPRPETEELVDWVRESFSTDFSGKMLDLCTGSGCIALALKSIFFNAKISGSDLSQDALMLAKENAIKTSLDVDFIQFDANMEQQYELLLNESAELFDCWVSNPPYIPLSDTSEMAENVLDFEPHMALFVENHDPLLFYQSISKMAMKFLKPKGLLFFEIHENLSDEVKNVLEIEGFSSIEIRKDLQGKSRMVKAEKM